MKIIGLLLILNSVVAHEGEESGSYWALYPGNATDECVVDDGEMVPLSCCPHCRPI